MTARRFHELVLLAILAGYLVIAGLYATQTPAWEAPDEPAHYNYIRQIAQGRGLPLMAPGDWDNPYLDKLKAARFSQESIAGRLDSVQYEDWQPPLYYLLAAPFFALTGGNLIVLRLFSVLLGAGVVTLTWFAVHIVVPRRSWLAHGAAAFVAFLPQHAAIMGSVSNDSLAELVIGLILIMCALYVGAGRENSGKRISSALLGLLMGIGLITKGTTYAFAAVIALAILIRAVRSKSTLAQTMRALLTAGVVALIIGGVWWARNISVYGGFDFMAQNIHDHVVIGQPTTSEYIAQHGISGWLSDGVRLTFQSFWGQFGWMGVPMTSNIYRVLLVITVFVGLGALIAYFSARKTLTTAQHDTLLLWGAAILLTIAAYGYYNLKFVQFQGRYLYPSLIPLALIFAVGLWGWASLFKSVIGGRVRWAEYANAGAMALLGLGMAAFALYALFRIVIPGLTG